MEPLFLFFLSIVFYRPPLPPPFILPDLLVSLLTQSSHLSCGLPLSCVFDVFLPQLSMLVCPASILTKWSARLILLLTNLPVRLHCIPTSFLRSFILVLSTLFVLVIRRTQLFSQTCSFCCCCSVNVSVSRPHRHAGVTHPLRTFPFSFFDFFSGQHDSVYLSPSIRSRLCPTSHSTSECPSSVTIPPRYTKLSTCLISLPSNLMFNSSLWYPTHITYDLSRLILSQKTFALKVHEHGARVIYLCRLAILSDFVIPSDIAGLERLLQLVDNVNN